MRLPRVHEPWNHSWDARLYLFMYYCCPIHSFTNERWAIIRTLFPYRGERWLDTDETKPEENNLSPPSPSVISQRLSVVHFYAGHSLSKPSLNQLNATEYASHLERLGFHSCPVLCISWPISHLLRFNPNGESLRLCDNRTGALITTCGFINSGQNFTRWKIKAL
jgi:hypothetical protein